MTKRITSVLLVSMVAVVAGGSASASGASSPAAAVAAAQKLVAQYASPISWTSPGPAINVSSLKGEKVEYVPISPNIGVTPLQYGGWKEAMDAAGLQTIEGDTNGTPDSWSRAVDQAIAQNVKLIQLQGVDPGQIQPAITNAHNHGIKIVEGFIHPLGQPKSVDMAAEVTFNSYKIGQLTGDAAIANSNGTVDAVIYHEADYVPVSDSIEAGIESEFKRLCPNTCKWKLVDITIPDWPTKLPLLTRTAIEDKSVNTIIPIFDGEVPYVVPAINQAGAKNRVKVVSFNATPAALNFLVKKDALVADLGDPLEMEGFQFADQDFRALLGKPAASETLESPPIEMFTPSNFTAAMLKKPELSWYGPLDFAGDYKKLWGLG